MDRMFPDRSDDPLKDSSVVRPSVLDSEVGADGAEEELRQHLLEHLVGHVRQVTGMKIITTSRGGSA